MVGLPRHDDPAEDRAGRPALARGLVGRRLPSRYDDELWELVPEEPGPPPEHLVAFVGGLPAVERALDLGCGDGRLTRSLRAEEVVAADVSDVALARAARRLPESRRVALTPDAPLPLDDGSFDLVLCAETVEHARDVQLLLSEARRVLRPGGVLAMTTPAHGRLTALRALVGGVGRAFPPLSPHLRFFTGRSLRRLLEEMGFGVVGEERRRGTLLVVARR